MNFSESKRTRLLIGVALAVVTIAVYSRVAGFDFTNYDDPDYVTDNKFVNGGLTLHGVAWAFTHCYASNWHPLTWISHMLDCQLFGMWAGGHHLVNLLLHTANSVILFVLLYRMTGAQWRSAMVAGLFALHPLHVESVAWISERKDVLSTFFGLLSLLVYVRYVKESKVQPATWEQAKVWRRWALVFYALGLLAKPMLVTLPFVLLLLDFWPLERVENNGLGTFFTAEFRRLVFEKWPWFALALAASIITFYAQKTGGAVVSAYSFTIPWRILNAINAYIGYARNACWPVHLSVFYPTPRHQSIWSVGAGVAFFLLGWTLALCSCRRWPFITVGWMWYVGTLIPVIGLVQVGGQAMADRYTYIPMTGLFIAAVWWIGGLVGHSKTRIAIVSAGACTILTLCAYRTVLQVKTWENGITLFRHATQAISNNDMAFHSLGMILYYYGDDAEALKDLQIALKLSPNSSRIHRDMGLVLARDGKRDEALSWYEDGLRLDPQNADMQDFLAGELAARGKTEEALKYYFEAVSRKPGNAEFQNDFGVALAAMGRKTEAEEHYAEAVRLEPENAKYQNNYATALARSGQAKPAIDHYMIAIHDDGKFAEAYSNLGALMLAQRRPADALRYLQQAVRLAPTNSEAHNNLGNTFLMEGDPEEARAEYEEACRLDPTNGTVQLNAGLALARLGQTNEALARFIEAAKLNPTSPEAHYEWGRQLFIRGQFQAALDQFSAALGRKPGYAGAEFFSGRACLKLGEMAAMKHLEAAARLRPDWADPLNAEAWALATSEDDKIRNGGRAVRLAEKAAELTLHKQPAVLQTLAAAYAEAGRFDDAVATARQGLESAQGLGQTNLAARLEQAMELYQARQPNRQKEMDLN